MFTFRPHILEYKIYLAVGAHYDAYGNPIPADFRWSDPFQCHVRELERERIFTYADGSQGVYRYDVWLDPNLPLPDNMEGLYVRLTDAETNRVIVEDKKVQQYIPKQLRTKLYL